MEGNSHDLISGKSHVAIRVVSSSDKTETEYVPNRSQTHCSSNQLAQHNHTTGH